MGSENWKNTPSALFQQMFHPWLNGMVLKQIHVIQSSMFGSQIFDLLWFASLVAFTGVYLFFSSSLGCVSFCVKPTNFPDSFD